MTASFPPSVVATLEKLLADPRFKKAMDYVRDDEADRFKELQELVVVHGAPFKEHLLRGPLYQRKLEQCGAVDCGMDTEGNVLGYIYGSGPKRPKILVEGHLDTVFPESTPLQVTEKDGRFYCPGIGDDTAALACNLSVLRAIHHAGLKPVGTLVFGGTVGEEGEGNARGIRFLMREHDDFDTVISVESHDADHVCLQAVGIRRLEFVFKGPGGHSWRAFGIPTPVHAMGRAIALIAEITPAVTPRTTYSVSIAGGGTSINSIPQEAHMKVDMRSVDPHELDKLASMVQSLVEQAVAAENLKWKSVERVTMSMKVIGAKPAGTLDEHSVTAQTALAITRHLGFVPLPSGAASTNQNIPVNMNVPALVVGSGGTFKGVHSLEESYTPTNSYKGAQKVLMLLFALAGLEGVCEPLAQPCLERGPVC